MTNSVTNQTPIPSQIGRRHTDPPGLWIAVVAGSVALHLLVFWLMRFYSYRLSLLQQQYSSSAVPIELVEISPTERSKVQPQAKPVSPKPSSTTQTSSAHTAKPAPASEDNNAIALTDNKTAIASKPNDSTLKQQNSNTSTVEQTTTTVQPQLTTKPEFTPKFTPAPVPPAAKNPQPAESTLPPQTSDNTDTPTSEQENSLPDKQKQASSFPNTTDTNNTNLPKNTSPSTNEQQESQPPISQIPPVPLPGQPDANISLGQSTPLPTIDPSVEPPPQLSPPENQTGEGLVASWDVFSREGMIDLLQKGVVRQDMPPEILAQPLGENTKNLPIDFLRSEPDLESVDLIASLAVDENGNLMARDANGNSGVNIIDINPEELAAKKSKYQQLLVEVFQKVSFRPAQNNGVSVPSNLVVNIKIERR
jgi:hypothetical protein